MKIILFVIIGIVASVGIGATTFFIATAVSGDSESVLSITASTGDIVEDAVSAEPVSESSNEPRFIGGEKVLAYSGPDGAVSSTIKTLASPDLPSEDPVTVGLFKRSEDNKLILGTGPLQLDLNIEIVGGGPSMPTLVIKNFGPDVEIVVPVGTLIFNDVTETPGIFSGDLEPGENIVQQQLKVIFDLSDIPENTIISVWGDKRGDRVVADVLVLKTETAGF